MDRKRLTVAPAFCILAYMYPLRRDLPLDCPSTLVIFFFNTRGASGSSTAYCEYGSQRKPDSNHKYVRVRV